MAFKKGNKPFHHKEGCKCMRCSHIAWNKNLTKETDERMAKISQGKKGVNNPRYNKSPWNKGLTKETDKRIKNISNNLKGHKQSEEKKRKISITLKGRVSPRKGIKKYIKICPSCNRKFGTSGKLIVYCSKECREKIRFKHYYKKLCYGCGKEFETIEKEQLYCSRICCDNNKEAWNKGLKGWSKGTKAGFQKGDNHPMWQGGKSYELYGIDWQDSLKKAIRERDRYICQVCNGSGYPIHHIDYNKKNCNPNNLITLCESCHSKTNYNREKWKDYFKKIIGDNDG